MHTIVLKNKGLLAYKTGFYVFAKPEGFNYLAGQYANFKLPGLADKGEQESSRFFSFASSPAEDDILIVTKITDSLYKQTLQFLPEESEVLMDEPLGNFTVEQTNNRPLVFLAGGIGIAPVRSIVINQIEKGLNFPLTVFCSNERPEEAAFMKELTELKKEKLKVVYTMTNLSDSVVPWSGETGFITNTLLDKYLADIHYPLYYCVGSPGFVKSMIDLLVKRGVKQEEIKLDSFTGYN